MSTRPVTLAEIAERAESLEDFGRHFRDWLHEIRQHSSRLQLAAVVEAEPPRLAARFTQGAVADAWLAAYAEHLAARIGRPVPAWADKRGRVSPEPWFATDTASPRLRLIALRDSPVAFKKRNLFTATVDLPLALRAGRPAKSVEEKRRNNAERQRRFQAKRQAELKQLRSG
ncbi:MAG: hypothetical protein HYX71_10945 [Opitutae bacterium]|nr:hypothetical protein [Opitutae bacterium]